MLAIGVLLAIAAMLILKATGSVEASYSLELVAPTLPVAIGTPIIPDGIGNYFQCTSVANFIKADGTFPPPLPPQFSGS